MQVVNYTEFRNNLTENLNMVNDDGDIVVVSRSKGKNVVVMSLEEYNSIQETLHLMSSKENQKRLDEAIGEMKKGKSQKHG
jgi:antitoxin YefM